ncbi:Gfo/Idh/MocA family protein [Paenibacillus sp. PAMC21692]|uniref:Gfo/Idh/MocA family protein n=1 Tax=Paenibacillus sp. PAMC21692 TaxID=2762320 RepID=UPI00164DE0D4|nr:Gfo/Idh/MocA family oxidoreductase [Paenibacillus sp. PAMC21692]QNK55284.1 Gfo/Idh/MocA family oxidoreductase [Paenibacillus sp. PAMC21692]
MDVNNQAGWLDLDYKPKLPKDLSCGIGIVGAGAIVQACHLPAYRMGGLNIIGIYDVDRDKAEAIARQFGIPHVFDTVERMLEHPDITIIDIAIPAKFQPSIVEKAAAAGKNVLCQKPLGESYEDALHIVKSCERFRVKGAVNQQMRWSPGIRASRTITERGWIGMPTQASIQVNIFTDWSQWPWITQIERLELMYHSIHYMDSIRSVFGTPEYIYADGSKFPGQVSRGETRSMIFMKFPGECRGLIHDNHNNIAGQDDWYATFRFEGTEGIIKGTNGALYNYPDGREDTLQFLSQRIDPGYWFSPKLEGRWFPHAFLGTMGELMRAIEEGREAENSVQDNLLTLQMLFASYRSIEENRPVRLDEIGS